VNLQLCEKANFGWPNVIHLDTDVSILSLFKMAILYHSPLALRSGDPNIFT
jgi:hypothetical protein